tara:strand:+ start:260 stop:481 length:222 start_codon:yes stop_codon:yes gene_type:complete
MENIKIGIFDAELHPGDWDNGEHELSEKGCLTIRCAAWAEPENLKKITDGILELFPEEHGPVGIKVSYSISNH